MIFVTVGTTHGFDRLIRAVDEAIDRGLIEDEVYGQIGTGTYTPRNFDYVCALDKGEFDACMKQASGVISHAGMGVVTLASDHGKRILVMPRRKRYREVVNDHQVAIAEEFARLGHVLHARNEKELLEQVGRLATFVPIPRKVNKEAVIDRIAGFLSSVRPLGRRRDRDR